MVEMAGVEILEAIYMNIWVVVVVLLQLQVEMVQMVMILVHL